MTYRDPSPVVRSPDDELGRAFDHFQNILDVQQAARKAIEMLTSLPEPEVNLAAMLRVTDGRNSERAADTYLERARDVLAGMAAERDRRFQVMRSSTLIAVCAAFEYVVKATFVKQAMEDSRSAASLLANIPKIRVRLDAADVLGARETEQWYAVADEIFRQLARDEQHGSMRKRVRRFLIECTLLAADHKAALAAAIDNYEEREFNEPFLTRNSLVHNGRRVSRDLAQLTGAEMGHPVEIDNGQLDRMLAPMRGVVQQLYGPL